MPVELLNLLSAYQAMDKLNLVDEAKQTKRVINQMLNKIETELTRQESGAKINGNE